MDEKSRNLERRMLLFAAEVVRQIERETISRVVRDQLIGSATSIGANYAEACNASSKADFRNKIFVSKKEAGETRYWIDLCIELGSNSGIWSDLRQEAHELLMILQSIINSTRATAKRSALKSVK